MKKILLSLLIVLGLISFLFAKKISFVKDVESHRLAPKKVHPVEKYFQTENWQPDKNRNFNKLLILLIDFSLEEPDDPQTTGNGKFIQDPGDYPISIGKPPHDHAYFTDIAEALRQYYLAVSYDSFDLQIDVFPQSGSGDFAAYTLPQTMSYYNPPGADQALMISRFEQYFADAFAEADNDDAITFSDYSHYMFIHAGADWQHDIFGDTPADIPSFFIQVGDGKEAIVDDGFVIDHACNIPETIIQDVSIDNSGTIPIVSNYGVINGVLVHEFGHSLGFADLYNTYNYTPQVGYYDIMDSGGSSLINFAVDEDGDDITDAYYSFEGIFPAFPGAWSRIIPFEDSYRARGILKDISDFEFGKEIKILPAGSIYDAAAMNDTTAYFVKIPINDSEYLLLENRQVDPDGDGGSAIQTNANQSVILHPTYIEDIVGNNYEYDYLLPGWIDEQYNSIGGGILMWHVDEDRLQLNNAFQNNMINVYHSRRSVRVVEADNIDDIGNPYSMFWWGTAFEPFYKYQPIINEDGFFTGWNDDVIVHANGEEEFIGEIFNQEYSATSLPSFLSNSDNPSFYSIYDISSYSIEYGIQRSMTLKFGTNLFDETQKIAEYDSISAIGMIGSSYGFPTFPILADSGISFYSNMDNSWQDNFGIQIPFQNVTSKYVYNMDQNADGEDEFAFVNGNTLSLIKPENIQESVYPSNITDAPIFIENWLTETLVIPTESKLFVGDFEYDIYNAKCVFNGEHLIAASENSLHFIPDPQLDGAPFFQVEIDNYDQDYIPVCFVDTQNPQNNATFVQNQNGDIYKIQNQIAEKIFSLYPYSSVAPTQLSIGSLEDQIYLVFGAGDRVFAITTSGTLKEDYPAYLEDKLVVSGSFPKIIKFDGEPIILIEENNGGYLAIDADAEQRIEYSFYWCRNENFDQFFWNQEELHFIYSDSQSNLYCSKLMDVNENPIVWSGFRNGNTSLFEGVISYETSPSLKLDAFAFPNPSRSGEIRIRIENAKDKINIKIFDIAANMLLDSSLEKEINNHQDFSWSTKSIASGVYFAVISSNGESKKVAFAIIN